MIQAVLYRDRSGRLTGFSSKGHSGYSEEGSDIICAGVSALTITCVNSLESVCGIVPQIKGGTDGYLEAHLPSSVETEKMHDAQVLFGALRQGLSDLAEQYPQFVELSIKNGGKHNDEA